MKPTYDELEPHIVGHLAGARTDAERCEIALTWEGYVTALQEWSVIPWAIHTPVSGLFPRYQADHGGDNPIRIIFAGTDEESEERDELGEERRASGEVDDPRYQADYWSTASRIRGHMRTAVSEAHRRDIALAWSGYVAALSEAGLIPPGHDARLYAELRPYLRSGDPVEAILRETGRPVALEPAGQG